MRAGSRDDSEMAEQWEDAVDKPAFSFSHCSPHLFK